MQPSKKIKKLFNLAIFVYYFINCLTRYLFEPSISQNSPWDKVFSLYPALSIIGALIILSFLIFSGSLIIKVFWNRFINDIFKVRDISFDESLAIILIIAIIIT